MLCKRREILKLQGKVVLSVLLLLLFLFFDPFTQIPLLTGKLGSDLTTVPVLLLVFPASPAPSHTPTFSPPLRCNKTSLPW